MSGGGRGTLKKEPSAAAKKRGKDPTGSREFVRKAKAAQRRAARTEAMRHSAAARLQGALSPRVLTWQTLTRIPAAARMCALLAFVNAACWSLITPPFQVPDEPDHFAYVQHLAETGSLPSSSSSEYSLEEKIALHDLNYALVRFRPGAQTISSRAQRDKLERDLMLPLSRHGQGAGLATSEPPLYYALQTIPYGLASKGTILDRLEMMRLLSALIGGVTALFVFLFLREALPNIRWAWTVGGLGVALAPLLGFVSGAVNPDALLFAVCAALFYCLARAFRQGLTRGSALAIGALIAIGLATKLNFIGLIPGAILGLVLLARRQAHTSGARVYYASLVPALLVATSPGLLYGLVNVLSKHPVFGIVSSSLATLTGGHRSIAGALSYIWQFYLPRLPGMHSDFGPIFTTRQIWFRDLVGLYGWSDTVFPGWVYDVALIPAGLIAALCLRELAACRSLLRDRMGELATYAAMSLGVLVLIGAAGYHQAQVFSAEYAQPRYLLPMLGLWGVVLALAARGAGRRWGPAVGTLIVVSVIAHDIFSQLQVIARYYG